MDKEIVANFENLYRSYKKVKNGKKFNSGTARFSNMALEGIQILKEQLENQTYSISPYNKFQIHEPKERTIESCAFKDKVVQRCFSDYILTPKLENILIKWNTAGQHGKGQHMAMNGLRDQMLDFYKRNGMNTWIVKCDIHKYFYSIDHEIMKDILDYYFDDDFTTWMNHLFIDSTDNPGLPLGNQVNQKYALLLLHSLDQMITIEFGNPYYGRYNDDFYVLCKTKDIAREILKAIRMMVKSLGLELNPKSQIVPFRMGLCYLGFHHYVTDEGKYIRKLRGDRKRNTQKKVRRWVRAVNEEKMPVEKFNEKYGACKNHMLHGNCIKLCHSMDLEIERRMK
jgi:hypothetical protein